jgi:nucleotide-binding universal stress UspA family protein
MKEHRNILIAMNGSQDVLIQGLKLIGPEKSRVTVIKVTPPFEGDLSLVGNKNIGETLHGVSEKTVSGIRNIAEAAGIDVKVRIEIGEIDKKIIEVAEEEKSDLIIMGAGSQSGIKKLFLGSVLDSVTYQAPCPVLVVNPGQEAPVCKFYQLEVYRANKERKALAELRPRYFEGRS